MSYDDLWETLDIATRLGQAVMKIVRLKTKLLFASEEFLAISRASLVTIVRQVWLDVQSETEVFWAAVAWGRARCREELLPEDGPHVRAKLGAALQHVRFLTTYEELSSCRSGCTVPNLREMVAVMECVGGRYDTGTVRGLNLSLYRQQRFK